MKTNAINHLTKTRQTLMETIWIQDGQPQPLPKDSLDQLRTVLDEVNQRIAKLRADQATNDKP